MAASPSLQWELLKSNNSFLVKRGRKEFSLEPNNLKSKNCFNSSGLVQKKTVGIEALPDGKQGVALVLRKTGTGRKPSQSFQRIVLQKQGPRRALSTIRKILRQQKYRRDLELAALRKASAILRSQRTVVAK